jgi:copper chaperone
VSTTATYRVKGMHCNHCVTSVSEEIGELPGVTDVDVDLIGGLVTVTAEHPLDDTLLRAAVTTAGFTVLP